VAETKLLEWKPRRSGKLRGYATIELPWGLQISKVSVFEESGIAHAALPRWPRNNRDGRHVRNEDGSYVWDTVLKWRDRKLSDGFAVRIGELVVQAHPGDFDRPIRAPSAAE